MRKKNIKNKKNREKKEKKREKKRKTEKNREKKMIELHSVCAPPHYQSRNDHACAEGDASVNMWPRAESV